MSTNFEGREYSMAENYTLIHDIIQEHSERALNLKKYYPFFKLAETTFHQYKDGRFASLDMGYITMAVLRFFIEENNFQEKEVSYEEYREFISALFKRDFDLKLNETEEAELALYIFDKIKNEGRPFRFTYFDPADKKKKSVRMNLIESVMRENEILYHISADAVEFYLDTKEIKEESAISIEHILLEKLIDSNNFKGAVEVVRRINNEVSRMQYKKNQVLQLLNEDLKEGIAAYEAFISLGSKWFAQEQKQFAKNSDLIQKALLRAGAENNRSMPADENAPVNQRMAGNRNTSGNRKTLEEIYELELQLDRAIKRHSELLAACTDLQKMADEIIHKAKFKALRSGFDFKRAGSLMKQADRPQLLAHFILPLMDLNRKKTFDLPMMDNLLTYRPGREETGEKIQEHKEETYSFPDEAQEKRIQDNYALLLGALLEMVQERNNFTLEEFQEVLIGRFGEEIFKNGDYYSFLVHLCQKKYYDTEEVRKKPETFLDDSMIRVLEKQQALSLQFELEMLPEERLYPAGTKGMEITNIRFTGGSHGR